MSRDSFFENEKSQVGLFFMKIGRSIWTAVIGLVIIITFLYGAVLNKVDSVFLTIIICSLGFGLIVFLSLNDVREARDYYEERRKAKRRVKRL